MSATITIDSTGGIPLPKAFLDKFALKPGAKLRVDMSEQGLALRPEGESGQVGVRVVEENGILVISGTEPFDAVDVIMAAREDRTSSLLR
jgi:hypothetical protein